MRGVLGETDVTVSAKYTEKQTHVDRKRATAIKAVARVWWRSIRSAPLRLCAKLFRKISRRGAMGADVGVFPVAVWA